MKRIFTVLLALTVICGVAEARKVTGTVKSGSEKLSGVIVTDGENFTRTKKNGKFSFEINDDAEFVYIVTPAGYVADFSSGVPAFYQAADGRKKFAFELQKTAPGNDYSIIAIADPQTQNEKHFSKFADKPMADLCETSKELSAKNTTVGLTLGDICWDSLPLLEKYKAEIVRTGIPFYPVVGNHDHEKDAQGDIATTATYRSQMGPENYAFCLGNDVVIVVDNIIYDTQKKYEEGYAAHVMAWVKGLLELIPDDTDLYVAQHSPLYRWFAGPDSRYVVNGKEMLELLKGHEVTFLSGHTHINNNLDYGEGMSEHNIAGLCGAWWVTDHNNDGTPGGYKVFTKKGDDLEWYYKSTGYPKDFQMEIFKPGQAPMHPNSVVANIWDWDPTWKVEWYEDGVAKGAMEEQVIELSPLYIKEINAVYFDKGKKTPGYKKPRRNYHYFAAMPSQYAKNVTITVESRFGQKWVYNVDMSDYVDVQAHRGGAGLMPENTIEAMKNALDMGVNTLELDLQVSADGKVVVSHDPYFHSRYAIRPDGSYVRKGDPKEYIYTMPYDSVARYDVGSRPSEVWPEKACIPTVKPLAEDLINFVESYTKEKGYSPVRYNIEIKCKEADGEGKNWPTYDAFVDACAKFLISKHLDERLVVQCFDARALNFMHEKYPELNLSYLVGAKDKDFDTYMAKLKFTPQWLSPHHTNTDAELVRRCHEAGMKIVPWTADNTEDIARLLSLDIDAIISNYPDRVMELTRGFAYPMPVLPEEKK
ncbi:MAG: calcineurin-like phosphoesterase C-terminal domain-containing protein [Bacteroidales bacterium]|nr:calcineurin-like phosphoesterase C-terminal domain-containing protein [Bacteroidales bacterium]